MRRAPRTTVQTQPRPRGCGVRQPSAGLGGHIPVVALRPCLPQKGRELFPEPGKVNAGAPSGPTSSPALPLQLQPLRSRASSSFPPHSQCGSGQQALDIQMGHCEGQPGWSLGLEIQKEEVLWRFQREARLPWGLWPGDEQRRTEARAARAPGGGPRHECLAMMAASTSGFWREVLKTPS